MKKVCNTALSLIAAGMIALFVSSCKDHHNNTEGGGGSGESSTTAPGTGGTQEGQGTTTGSPQSEGDTLNSTTRGNSTIGDDESDAGAERP